MRSFRLHMSVRIGLMLGICCPSMLTPRLLELPSGWHIRKLNLCIIVLDTSLLTIRIQYCLHVIPVINTNTARIPIGLLFLGWTLKSEFIALEHISNVTCSLHASCLRISSNNSSVLLNCIQAQWQFQRCSMGL